MGVPVGWFSPLYSCTSIEETVLGLGLIGTSCIYPLEEDIGEGIWQVVVVGHRSSSHTKREREKERAGLTINEER